MNDRERFLGAPVGVEVSIPVEVGGILGNKGMRGDAARKLLDQAIAAAQPFPAQKSEGYDEAAASTYRSDWETVETGDATEALLAIKRGAKLQKMRTNGRQAVFIFFKDDWDAHAENPQTVKAMRGVYEAMRGR